MKQAKADQAELELERESGSPAAVIEDLQERLRLHLLDMHSWTGNWGDRMRD